MKNWRMVIEVEKKLFEITKRLLESGNPRRAAAFLAQKHPEDVADVLERLDRDSRIRVFKYLPVEMQAEVLLRFDENVLDEILKTLSESDISDLVGELDVDDAVDLIQELDPNDREKVLLKVPEDDRIEVEKLLKYPEHTAGGLMTTEFISMTEDSTVGNALDRIKTDKETENSLLSQIFVTDSDGKLKGVVSVSDLLKSSEDKKLGELVSPIESVSVNMDQEEVARVVERYDLFSVPVVDDNGRLVGVITIDDLIDVIEEEASEDIAKFGGLGDVESIFAPPHVAARHRLPWLLINLITAFIAAGVVNLFKSTVAAVVYLAVFMPIVAGMGGNAGTQALAITIRSIALGEVMLSDVKKLLLKEIMVGVIIGAVVGIVTGFIAYIWVGKWFFGVLVFAALLGNMIVACMMGLLIPIGLKLLKLDPALASGVIVTTFTDVSGFMLLLGLATLFVKYLQ